MPFKPKAGCLFPGCPYKSYKNGYCKNHQAHTSKVKSDRKRGSASSRGYGSRWKKARAAFLADNPLCVKCAREGRNVLAKVVDHKVAHKGDEGLFWNESNWQPLCTKHHNEKTVKYDGGFGNKAVQSRNGMETR